MSVFDFLIRRICMGEATTKIFLQLVRQKKTPGVLSFMGAFQLHFVTKNNKNEKPDRAFPVYGWVRERGAFGAS
jgi:hypothetical protein